MRTFRYIFVKVTFVGLVHVPSAGLGLISLRQSEGIAEQTKINQNQTALTIKANSHWTRRNMP